MGVGTKLRAIREAKDIGRAVAAVGSGLPYDTLIAIETERIKSPGWDKIEKLASYYGISMEELRSNSGREVTHDNILRK